MTEALLMLLGMFVLFVIIVLIFAVAPVMFLHRMDKRAGVKSWSFFDGEATNGKKTLSIILGAIFAAVVLYQYFFANWINCLFAVMAALLLDYGFGGKLFFNKLQKKKDTSQNPSAGQAESQNLQETSSQPSNDEVPPISQ